MVSCVRIYLLLIPYDGNSIGKFISDAIRNITGTFNGAAYNSEAWGAFGVYASAEPVAVSAADNNGWRYDFGADRVVPVSYENRPASISVGFYISY